MKLWAVRHYFLSKLDSPEINTLLTHSLNVKKCLSNVLITGESNFDEKSVPTAQNFIHKVVPSCKIHTLFYQKTVAGLWLYIIDGL